MSVIAPPPPPIPEAHEDPQALIEEARRRARRRRRRNGAAAAIVVGAAALVVAGHGWGGTAAPKTTPRPDAIHVEATSGTMRNGALTVINQAQGHGGVFTVGRGGLARMVLRCHGVHSACLELQNIAWSPDGTKIALGATSYGIASSYDGLHVVDLATGRDRQLTGSRMHPGAFADPAWSPDGAWLAYEGDGLDAIALAKVDGSRREVLRPGAAGWIRSPSWSPDGTRIAFEVGPRGGCGSPGGAPAGCEIYSVRLDGTHLHLLATHAAAPAWSPVGTAIAYQARCGIRLVTPSGKDVTPRLRGQRCRHIGIAGQPVWSPDGRRIAVAHDAHGPARGVYVMNSDGTHLVHLTRATGFSAVGVARASWRPRP
jgi:Tol biopolymer transport system component